MKFFKPADFDGPACLSRWVKFPSYEYDEILKFVAERANQVLYERSSIVWGVQNLIGNPDKNKPGPYWSSVGAWSDIFRDQELAYTARLVDVNKIKTGPEPVEKEVK